MISKVKHLPDSLTFLPLALSYLMLCFPLQPLSYSARPLLLLQVMLWFTQVSLPFPFAKKALSCFYWWPDCWASGRADILFPFSPRSATETQSHLQTPVLLSCLPQTPSPPALHSPCLWLCQSTVPLFYLTIQLGPDNNRKRSFISIFFNTSWWVVLSF